MRRMARMEKIGQAGRASEKGLAKRLKGRPTRASGAVLTDKGDIDLPEFLMECKSTKNDSLSVKLEWLLKITQEAVLRGKKPAFAISFTNDHGKPIKSGTFIAIPEDVFKTLIGE